jgi:hypothetical protein
MPPERKTFRVTVQGVETELFVQKPSPRQKQEAEKIRSKAFRKAIDDGALLRARAEQILVDQGLWTDADALQYQKLAADIEGNLARIKAGGIKLSEARQLAVEVRILRARQRDLLGRRSALESETAESRADQAEVNCLAALCTVYAEGKDAGKPFFRSVEDFESRADEPVAVLAASHAAFLLYGLDPDYDKRLPENEFLVKYKLADPNDLHLTDKDGHRVDAQGNRIDSSLPDPTAPDSPSEPAPFLDDDGNPLPS